MKARKILFLVIVMVLLTAALFAQTSGDYRVRSSVTTRVDWSGTTVWQKYTTSWANTTTPPTSADGVITIPSTAIINIGTGVTVDQVVVLGQLIIPRNQTLTVSDGSGTDLSVQGSGLVTLDGGTVSVAGSFTVSSGSSVSFNSAGIVSGAGSFTLSSGATLRTKNADGIASSASTGSVRTTTRTFDSGANYVYDASDGLQTTGDGIPSTVNELTIQNVYGVQLSKAITISNKLNFASSGTLSLDNYDLTMGASSSATGTTYFEYTGTGVLVDNDNRIAVVDYLECYVAVPLSLPDVIDQLLLQADLVVPNDFAVRAINFSGGKHIELSNYVMTLTGNSLALTGSSIIHTLTYGLAATSNTLGSATSIARTWTTSAEYISSTLEAQFSYPETETSAASVKVWKRVTGNTGHWTLVGTYATTGTTTRTVSVPGITNFGETDIGMDWTISNVDQTLPVELSSFTATPVTSGFVRMDWITQSETGVQGFYVYRNTIDNIASAEMVSPLIQATNTSVETSYSFTDREVPGDGTYYYWLQNQDINGSSDFFGPIMATVQTGDNDTPDAPLGTRLNAPYPNPFNPSLTVSFDMVKADNVQIYIYNAKGQLIRTLLNAAKNTGYHRVVWDGKTDSGVAVTTGMYYVKMVSDKYKATHKVMMMK